MTGHRYITMTGPRYITMTYHKYITMTDHRYITITGHRYITDDIKVILLNMDIISVQIVHSYKRNNLEITITTKVESSNESMLT